MAASAATVAPPPTVDRASSRKGTTQFTFHEDPPTPEAVPESAAPSKTLPRLDTSTSSASSSARGPRSASDALISPSSARASDSGFSPSSSRPPKPPSRPPSRPPSLSRPPSVYRPRSPSSVSRLSSSGGAGGTYGGPGTTLHTDPKRLSASSGTSGGGGGHGHGGFSSSSPRSPARSSGGVATSPQILEDAAVSAASTTSTDQTTPSPSAAVAEPPPMPKASEPGAAPASASGVLAPTEEPAAPAAATAEPHADPATTPADLPVFVRDYAFPREDPRFKGEMLPEEIEAAARKQRFRESGAEQGFLVDEDGMGPPVGGGGAGGNSSCESWLVGPTYTLGSRTDTSSCPDCQSTGASSPAIRLTFQDLKSKTTSTSRATAMSATASTTRRTPASAITAKRATRTPKTTTRTKPTSASLSRAFTRLFLRSSRNSTPR